MCKHIVLLLPNMPGQFSQTSSILSENNVNILGYCLSSEGRPGVLYLLCSPHEKAFTVLKEEYSHYCSEHEVLVVEAENQAGTLEPILRILSENEINLPNSYQAASTRATALIVLEFGKEGDLEKARHLLCTENYKVLSDVD